MKNSRSIEITAKKNASVGLTLDNVDITSGNYPAIAVGPKTATTYVTLKNINYLTDGRIYGIGYSSANGTDYYDQEVDPSLDVSGASETQKWALGSDDNGTLTTKGIFRISGDGILNVSTAYKHGIYAKNRIYLYGGKIAVENSGRNGIQSKNGFDMEGGTVYIHGTGEHTNKQSRGIIVLGDESSDGYGLGGIRINDGTVKIDTTGKAISAKWDIEDDAETTTTDDDPSPVVVINGGNFDIKTRASVIDSDFSSYVTYYDADGISTYEKEKCSPEGIEGKLGVKINGGTFVINTTDDALNASRSGDGYINISGGDLYLNATSADAIDSNGSIKIIGGTIVAIATMGSENAFDCDDQLVIENGTLIGLAGSSEIANTTGTSQITAFAGSSTIGNSGSSFAIKDESGNVVYAFTIPSVASNYSLATISSPNFSSGKTYSVYSGVSLSGGKAFNGLYTTLPSVSSGTETKSFTTTSGSYIYNLGVDSNGGPGGGGPGGTPPMAP